MANGKRCSAPLTVRDTQITVIMANGKRCSAPMTVRHADHSHSEASPHTRQDGCRQRQQHQKQQTLVRTQRNGSPGTLLLVMQLSVAIVENSMEIPQNAKSRSTVRSSNATPGYVHKGDENANSKIHIHPSVYSSVIYNRKDTEAT